MTRAPKRWARKRAGPDGGAPRQGLDGLEPAVVVLVPVVEVLGDEGSSVLALAPERVQHLREADGMPVIEVDHAREQR